jgi:hypothetical protein
MKKTLTLALAMAALAVSAFAVASPPPSTASPPGKAIQVVAVRDVSPVSLTVADTGAGAQSAFKAWAEKRSAQPAPSPTQVLPSILTKRIALTDHGGGSAWSEADGPMELCWNPDDDAEQSRALTAMLLHPVLPHARK